MGGAFVLLMYCFVSMADCLQSKHVTSLVPVDCIAGKDGSPLWQKSMPKIKTITRTVKSFVDLKCPAEGHPTANITWFKDGEPFVTSKMKHFYLKRWKLTIGDLLPDDEGLYTCVISNQHGSINWTYAVKIIQRLPHKPNIEGPKNQTVVVGHTAIFNCKIVEGYMPLHLEWIKHYMVNGSWKKSDGEPYYKVIQTERKNNTNPEQLIISNVTSDDAGWYTCIVSNAIGWDYGTAWLTVTEDRSPFTLSADCTSYSSVHIVRCHIDLRALSGKGNGNELRMSVLTVISILSLALHNYVHEELRTGISP